MKRIALLLMLFVAFVSMAQIKKVETVKEDRVEIGKYFTYKDATYQVLNQENTFKIQDVDNAFESLYTMIAEGFETMPKDPIMVEFPDGYLWLSYKKFLGTPIIQFGHSNTKNADFATIGFSQEFTKKQIDKLFGKKK